MISKEQLKDRASYYGGSDINVMIGKSAFKKPVELLFEKAKKKEFTNKSGIYAIFGNCMEEKIQELYKIINLDHEEYETEYEGIKFKFHVDGREEKGVLVEIKTSNKEKDKVAEMYDGQIRSYMWGLNEEKIKIINYKRSEKDDEFLKGITEKYKLKKFNGNLEIEVNEEKRKEIEMEIKIYCKEMEVKKKDCQTKVIKRDKGKEKELLGKIKKFNDLAESIEKNPFIEYTVENIKEYEKEIKKIMGLEIKIENDNFDIYASRLKCIKAMEEQGEVKEYIKYVKDTEEVKESIKNEVKENFKKGKYTNGSIVVNKYVIEKVSNDYVKALEKATGFSEKALEEIKKKATKEIVNIKITEKEGE